MKLNIGCGYNDIKEGFINIDKKPFEGVDYVMELGMNAELLLNFEENSVDFIRSYHAFEHINNLQNLVKDCAYVSKNGAIWEITVPYVTYTRNLANPYHVNYFDESTFDYWDTAYQSEAPDWFKLKKESIDLIPTPEWKDKDYMNNKDKYLNVIEMIKFRLRVEK